MSTPEDKKGGGSGLEGEPPIPPKRKSFKSVARASSVMASKPVPLKVLNTKMDLAKALSTLGFTSTRWLDMSSGMNPKEELDKAHFNQMMEIVKKKRQSKKEENTQKAPSTVGYRRKQPSMDDEVRILHEAYQFLLKKYKLGDEFIKEEKKLVEEQHLALRVLSQQPISAPQQQASNDADEGDEGQEDVKNVENESDDSIIDMIGVMTTDEVQSEDEDFIRSTKLEAKQSVKKRRAQSFRN